MLSPLGPDVGGGPSDGGPSLDVSPSATPSGAMLAAEVDTEYEEDAQEEGRAVALQLPAQEVEEEELEAMGSPVAAGPQDYKVPAANKEVWKQFGCNTEAGRVLRSLYKSGSQSDRGSMVAYPRMPSPSQRWEPKSAPRKPCPQRAPVRVPRGRRATPDPDDPRNWRQGAPGRRPAHEIMLEIEGQRPEVPDLPKGRDQFAEKQQLQDRFQFCGGRAMPKGAMGNVENAAALPHAGPSTRSVRQERKEKDENGMNAEQREIFEELMLAVKRKQERLREINAEEGKEDATKPSKVRTSRNKEALELRNDVDRCMRDIDKLMELTEQ